MWLLFGCVGWLVGIGLSCYLIAEPSKLPLFGYGFYAPFRAGPILALIFALTAIFIGWRRRSRLNWPPGLGCISVLVADAAFIGTSWHFWRSVPPHASIRPMAYAMFELITVVGILVFGVFVAFADLVTNRRSRWIGLSVGVVGIALALAPWWCDQAIIQHFQNLHHWVFED